MFVNNLNLEDDYYNQFYLDELAYQDEESIEKISSESIELANNLFNALQNLINDNLLEQFTSQSSSQKHYEWHCLGDRHVRSTRTKVYYDFTDYQDYLNHEQLISDKTKADNKIFIQDFSNGIEIAKAFRKFFEGNKCLVFGLGCGFHNNTGKVRFCFNAYATEYTTNYINNTVDFLIQAPDGNTITIYPLDTNYLESKINNEIAKIPELMRLRINY